MKTSSIGLLFAGVLGAVQCAWPLAAQAQPKGPPPGPQGEGPEGMRPGPGPEEERVVDELKREHPAVYENLMELRQRKPEAFRQKVWGMRPMLKDPAFRKEVIENIELDMQLRKLAGAYKESKDSGEKNKLKADIRQALEKQFDAKLAMNERRLAKMEKEIGELKSRIEKRRGKKKDLVDKRLGQITGDEEGWDW